MMAGKILIYDGIASNRIILRSKLSAACYDVVQAESYDDLLYKAQAEAPDLVICDFDQAPQRALAMCRRFCGTLAGMSVPVLLLATAASPTLRIAALRSGAWGVMAKPPHDDLLLASLRQILRQFHGVIESRNHTENATNLGLAEPAITYGGAQDCVAILSEDATECEAWRARLQGRLTGVEILVMSPDEALSPHARTPDAFVITARPQSWHRNLRVVSELHSRSATRHSRLLMMMSGPEGPQGSLEATSASNAAMALDLGADDVLLEEVHPSELALRLETQIARKRIDDSMRRALNCGIELAARDPLTSLYNRRFAVPRLERMLRTARERNKPLALMALDLDRFKAVNDTHGHAAGDAVLVEVARRLSGALRPLDLLARSGGEEFWIALPDADDACAAQTAQTLRQLIRTNPIVLPDRRGLIRVTISIGVAVYSCDPETADDETHIDHLLNSADSALYAAKTEGRDTVTFAGFAA